MANSVVISQQPTVTNITEPVETDWNSGLMNCCDDMNTCCCGFWCCPCLACDTTAKLGENKCFPLFDICCPVMIANAFGIPLFVPPAALGVRVAIRYKYKIKGSLCNDAKSACFCMWCSWCQLARELKYRKKNPTVINNLQPPNITIIQNAPTVSNHTVSQETHTMPASQPFPVSAPGYPAQPPVGFEAQPPPPYPGHLSQQDAKPPMFNNKYW